MPVGLGVLRAAALPVLAASVVLMLVAGAVAQSPPPPPPAAAPPQPKPVTGFVPTFEIMRTVRSAGFDPLAPPLRDGTAYVLRATDYRGILMRVVLDARTGAIRDVTRIVPAASGSLGVVMPPYGPPRYETPYADVPYNAPADYEGFPPPLPRPEDGAASQLPPPITAPPVTRAKTSARKFSPPLPVPRPSGLVSASQKTEKVTPMSGKGAAAVHDQTEQTTGNAAPIAPQPNPAAAPPAAQANSPAAIPLND
jgi:hypothetical protein